MGGEFNEVRICFGRRGVGKSTLAAQWARELYQRAVVVVHDPIGGFPSGSGFERHRSLRELTERVKRGAGGVQVVSEATSSDFCGMVSHLVEQGQRPPIVAVFDEAALLDNRDRLYTREVIRDWLVSARHRRLGLVLVTQSSNLIDYHAIGLATLLALFQCTDGYAIDKLARQSVPRPLLDHLPSLAPYHYYEGQPGGIEWPERVTVR